jgi:hypothetical protein
MGLKKRYPDPWAVAMNDPQSYGTLISKVSPLFQIILGGNDGQ